jgi:hypothetical protein
MLHAFGGEAIILQMIALYRYTEVFKAGTSLHEHLMHILRLCCKPVVRWSVKRSMQLNSMSDGSGSA